jgi:hypothetical protein
MSMPMIVCIHVVPHFDGALMITSSDRRSKFCHRALSDTHPW